MLTTTVMGRLGYVRGNRMVHMQLSNHKLWDRGIRMLQQEFPITEAEARQLLRIHGSVDSVMRQLDSSFPLYTQQLPKKKSSASSAASASPVASDPTTFDPDASH
jgi:N-acetylmuramic acid 6-phosphate (MurNAc-6-P) etherase